MNLDPMFVSEMPAQVKQELCHQIRQQQVKNYVQFEKSDRGCQIPAKKKNKGGSNVHFTTDVLVQAAITEFNDREVVKLLAMGGNPNFTTGNGTSLLHICTAEDNVSCAELLLAHGADINVQDDDWWTPLHIACLCDSVDSVQFLLNNGADVTAINVDGFFPFEQAPKNSETLAIMTKHQESLGLTMETLKQTRQSRAREMYNYVKNLPLSTDVNQLNGDGVTLLHIAAANGYRSSIKVLSRFKPDVNKLDDYGWSPLHVAARFNQLACVKLLLKHKANPNLQDSLGCKPSYVTDSDEIKQLLMKYESKWENSKEEQEHTYMEFTSDDNRISDDNLCIDIIDHGLEDEVDQDFSLVRVSRINSKTVRTRNLTLSKEDEIREAQQLYESDLYEHINTVGNSSVADNNVESQSARPNKKDVEDDYISMAIWKSGGKDHGNLVSNVENDDLIAMAVIKEETIILAVQKRYSMLQIYTHIGDILVAINPFQELQCYAKDISMKYHHCEPGTKLPPHIYGIAENSYKQLFREKKPQCHIISGESGSGKTESCKHIIQHLLRVTGSEETNLSTKINQMNPLLEAFGNAVTVMNNNSSRFGKYIEVGFNEHGKVTGAKISQYLLEKSRVVHQGVGESNFHIFSWMIAGLSQHEKKAYRIENMANYRYLQSSFPQEFQSVPNALDNTAKFLEVKQCLEYIGFSLSEIENIFQTISVVLNLGEIKFRGLGNNESALVDNLDILKTVAEVIDVSLDELASALVEDYTITRGEHIKKERSVQQACDCLDALAKTIYARMFSWIVNGINQLIQPAEDQGIDLQIGILDIFGFENFPQNSFEQICINVANEQIQMYTNEQIFCKEHQDCLLEGIPVVELNYTSNQPILDLFLERHTGLLAILDEESNFPKSTDKSLATKLHQNTGKKHAGHYKTPRDGGLCFTIVHYAGSVTYNVTSMLEKNRDVIPSGIVYIMKTSNCLLIKELFQSKVMRTGSLAPSTRQLRSRRTTTKKCSSPFDFFKKLKSNKRETKVQSVPISVDRKGQSTLAYHFRNSLSELIAKLQLASPHFMRCIKSNTTKTAMKFVPEYVLAQFRYTGISEIVKIRKFGYAQRLTFYEFLSRYPALMHCYLPQICPLTDVQKCELILKRCGLQGVKFGKTMLFFKIEHVESLEDVSASLKTKVTIAQSVVRGFLGRQKFKCMQEEHKRITSVPPYIDDSIIKDTTVTSNLLDSQDDNNRNHKDEDNVYDDAFSVYQHDENLYDDAFSVQQHMHGEHVNINIPPDNMNGQMSRGCPPSPVCIPVHTDPSRPPPSPREMYAPGNRNSQLSTAPPLPRRNPETRISSSSIQDAVYPGYPYSPSARAGNTAAYADRCPSPPLPPPPPELLEDYPPQPLIIYVPQNILDAQCNQHLPYTSATAGTGIVQQPIRQLQRPMPHPGLPPPLPPVSSIPKIKTKNDIPSTNLNVPQIGVDVNAPSIGSNLNVPYTAPSSSSRDGSQGAAGLAQEISKVQLKKTGLNRVSNELVGVREPEAATEISYQSNDASFNYRSSSDEPQVIMSPTRELQEIISPTRELQMIMSPTGESQMLVSPIKTKFEKQAKCIDGKGENHIRNPGDTSMNSSMDINIDDIDLNDVPGYIAITKSIPVWKKELIEKKNQEKIQEYIIKKKKEKEEADKWQNVPAWKKKLMLEKEKEKEKLTEDEQKKNAEEEANRKKMNAEEEANRKKMAKQTEEERKAKIKEQQEMEKQMQEELQDVPEWKREIMMKRGGAIKNWKDERENEPQNFDRISGEMQQTDGTPEKKSSKSSTPRRSLEEAKIEEEWGSLPLWKREVMMKRGGAIKNWADEREELNEQFGEQRNNQTNQ